MKDHVNLSELEVYLPDSRKLKGKKGQCNLSEAANCDWRVNILQDNLF